VRAAADQPVLRILRNQETFGDAAPAERRNHVQNRLLAHRASSHWLQKDCSQAAGRRLQGWAETGSVLYA